MAEITFADDTPAPTSKITFVDPQSDDEKAEALWAGRPVTLSAVQRVAKEHGTTPDAVMSLGTGLGKFESQLGSTVVGQGLLRAGQGLENVAGSIVGSTARALGFDSVYERVKADQKRRDEFLTFIEKGGDTESVLGERGSRIYGETMKLVGNIGGAGVAGPTSVYSLMINDSWQAGLDDAQNEGLSGLDSVAHAGRSAVIMGGISYLMGRIPGIKTLETSFSGAAKNEIQSFMRSPGMRGKMLAAAKELGGIAASGAEQMMISGGQQINDMALDPAREFDWSQVFEQGAIGVTGRGAIGAYKGLHETLNKYTATLPERAKGIHAADTDMARGVNPLEALQVKGNQFETELGHKEMSKESRDSYRRALEFYVEETRNNGKIGALQKMEQDVVGLQEARKAKPAEGQPAPEPPKSIDERATQSMRDIEQQQPAVPAADNIVKPEAQINPYILAPWESETRQQRRIRLLSRDLSSANDTIQGLRKGVKENQRLTKAQQDAALELVQDHIPKSDQWKFSRGILDATRPKLIDKLLDRMQKHVDARDHRLAVDALGEAFGKAKNLRTEFGDLAKGVRRSVDVRKFNGREAAETIRKWADDNPDALLTKADAATLERLGKVNVHQMAPDDIRGLASYVEQLAYESAAKDRLIGFNESASVRDTGDIISQQAANVKPLEMTSDSVLRQAFSSGDIQPGERTLISRLFHEAGERPEVTLNRISPELKTRLYDEVRGARGRYKSRLKTTTEALAATFQQVGLPFETSVGASAMQALGHNATPLEAWREQTRKINGIDLTRGEALQLVRWLDDPVASKALQASGVDLSGERTLGPFDGDLMTQLTEFVGDQGLAIKDTMFQHDNTFVIDGVNDANQRMTGRALTDKKNVVPIVRAEEEYQNFLTNPRSGFGMREALADSYGHLKYREGGTAKLRVPEGMDAIDMFMKHADRMHRFSEYGLAARNSELMLNDPVTKKAILRTNGKQGYQHIVDSIRGEVAGFNPTDATTRNIARWNSMVAGSMIAGKLSVMAAQPLDTIAAAAYNENGFAHLAAGMKEYGLRGLPEIKAEMDAVLGQNSGEYWSRNNHDNYAGEVTSGQFRTRGYFRPQSLVQQAFRPLNASEFYAAQMPNYLAAKAAAREKFGLGANDYGAHPEHPQWVQSVVGDWEAATYRGSNTSDAMELPASLQYAKTNPAAGLIMNFYNTASKVYSLFSAGSSAVAARDYKSAGRFLGAAAASTAMFAAMQEALSLGEKDKEKHGFISRAAMRAVTNTIGLHPAGGQIIADQLVRPMLGLHGFSENPVLLIETITSAASGAGTLVSNATGMAENALEPEQELKKWQQLGNDLGSLLGLPVPAIVDYTRRASKLWHGGSILPGTSPAAPKSKKSKKARSYGATSPY